jgi:tetratricopeptide (TPR) repeat protein
MPATQKVSVKTPPWKTRVAVFGVVLLASLSAMFFAWNSPADEARRLLQQAKLQEVRGNLEVAENLARQAYRRDATLKPAAILAARCAIGGQNFESALADLDNITEQDNEWPAAQGMSAQILHNHLFRLRDAEKAYRAVLSVRPDDTAANDGLARLLGLCGRRSEAIPCVLRLIRAGYETDLTMMLALESGSLSDPELLAAARQADPTDPNPLLGMANQATSDEDASLALEWLNRATLMDGLSPEFHGRYGQQLLANQRTEELNDWVKRTPDRDLTAETWLVRAELAEQTGDRAGAIRCYWEAVKLRPESEQANFQLARHLTSEQRTEEAAVFAERAGQLNDLRTIQRRTVLTRHRPTADAMLAMVNGYSDVGRLWEAYAWAQTVLRQHPTHHKLRDALLALRPQLVGLPLVLTAPKFNPGLQVDLSDYPIPFLKTQSVAPESGHTSPNISFSQQRSGIGFNFQYFDGVEGQTHRMFQFNGGGIAVLDADNDGAPDLFCTQGRTWGLPVDQTDGYRDRLFRNRRGEMFADVTSLTSMQDNGFGQGVSVGDFNNDGFADVYVANIGRNTLWHNNGDGTFTDRSDSLLNGIDATEWTTSCLIADLNGDTFPDIYDVNYLTGDDVFERLCLHESGDPKACAPFDFDGEIDRVWLNDGAGGFVDTTARFLSQSPNGKGLGIAAWDTGNGRLSLFVANDTTANHFYTADSPEAQVLTEHGVTSGLAYNGTGKAEACMGIAVGDCNQDGRVDLLVTNFLYESNTLYSPLDERLFEDQTRRTGLHDSSLSVLGFGTQFLDANLDGRLELFVTNGYTTDLSKYGTPYKMLPHVYEWTGAEFQQLPPSQLGTWSETPAVGRSVARLDWNLDGKPDLAVGLIDAESFLLTNTSQCPDARYLSLQLIGIPSSRDALGATVTVKISGKTFVHQLSGGDGYQCTNERRLIIGCNDAERVDFHVTWPSGTTQQLYDIQTSQFLILREGADIALMPR